MIGCAVAGGVLGALAARFTALCRRDDGTVIARAGLATLALWSAGPIGRVSFGLYAEHGGARAVATFSAAHGLAFNAWAAALTLMALCEVIGRTVVLAPRLLQARHRAPAGSSPPPLPALLRGQRHAARRRR